MYERRFSTWTPWSDRETYDHCGYPGVYVIALRSSRRPNQRFSWSKEIVYIGMTNSLGGLRSRLRQFDQTMAGSLRHGGADRMRFKHRNYSRFSRRAYVAIAPFPCNPGSALPRDLRIMGEVARFEFLCLAAFAERFGDLPKFNKRSARKFSHAKLE